MGKNEGAPTSRLWIHSRRIVSDRIALALPVMVQATGPNQISIFGPDFLRAVEAPYLATLPVNLNHCDRFLVRIPRHITPDNVSAGQNSCRARYGADFGEKP